MLASLGEEIERLRNDVEGKADRSVLGEAAKHLEEKLQKLDEGMEELSRKQEMTTVDLKDTKREVRPMRPYEYFFQAYFSSAWVDNIWTPF